MSELHKLIGKEIIAVRGRRNEFSFSKSVEARYILLSKEGTYIDLQEQDYHDYHDCSSSARYLTVREDVDSWKRILNDLVEFPEATEDP